MNKNFTNGALVFRVWHFDGSGELLAKFQYAHHAESFAQAMASDDQQKRPGDASKYFYLAACEAECSVKSFWPVPRDPKDAR